MIHIPIYITNIQNFYLHFFFYGVESIDFPSPNKQTEVAKNNCYG